MQSLISIVPAPDGHFIAQQGTEDLAWLSILIVLCAILLLVIAIRTRAWLFLGGTGMLLLVASFLFFNNRCVTYKMELTPEKSLHYQTVLKDQVTTDANIPLADIASADMEYQRQNSRIVTVMRDGTSLYPLGDDWVNSEPEQHVVVNAIREAIGQIPAAPAPH